MLILDLSSVTIQSTIELFRSDKKTNLSLDLMRHVTLSTILRYINLYKDQRPVIAVDGKRYWRKFAYEHYKGHRDDVRDKSLFDWAEFFKMFSQVIQDLKEYFPYIVIDEMYCEADDVIAALTNAKNEPVNIISSDKDMLQLQLKHSCVYQYSPNRKKVITPENTDYDLITHILRGDPKDNIPNVYTDQIVKGTRQKAITSKFIQKVQENGVPDEIAQRYKRNQLLIDFDYIPKRIISQILSSYNEQRQNPGKSNIYKYLVEHKMKLLFDRLGEF